MDIINSRMRFRSALFCCILIVLAGCATGVGPGYDKSVVDGIKSSAGEVYLLLDLIPDGTTAEYKARASSAEAKAAYNERVKTYARILGNLDTLILVAGNRYSGRAGTKASATKASTDERIKAEVENPTKSNDLPSVKALYSIRKTIVGLREADATSGISTDRVERAFEHIDIEYRQALANETFLNVN
jgi:hypothetical protein